MHWDVIQVKAVAPLALEVAFADGLQGKVLFQTSHLIGVFSALKEPELFNQVFIEGGAVAWPGDLDLAPDAMYEAIKKTGSWILH